MAKRDQTAGDGILEVLIQMVDSKQIAAKLQPQ